MNQWISESVNQWINNNNNNNKQETNKTKKANICHVYRLKWVKFVTLFHSFHDILSHILLQFGDKLSSPLAWQANNCQQANCYQATGKRIAVIIIIIAKNE